MRFNLNFINNYNNNTTNFSRNIHNTITSNELTSKCKKSQNITQNSQIEVNTTLSNYENIINNYINNSREEISSNTKLAGIFVG